MKNKNSLRWNKKFLISVLAVCMTFCFALGCAGRDDSPNTDVNDSTTFELNVFSHTMLVNETYQLSIESSISIDESACVWTSSDGKVVTVDDNGFVLAVGTGTADVTVTMGEYKSDCTFVVPQSTIKPYLKLNVAGNRLSLLKEDKYDLSATVEYNGKAYTDFSRTFESKNQDVVTVSEAGEITAVAFGKAKVVMSAVWHNGITMNEVIDVEVISGNYISVDKTDVELFAANPDGYDFVTSAKVNATLFDDGKAKKVDFTVRELVDGASIGEVAVYNDGQISAVDVGSTKFVFTCTYEGEELVSDEINVKVKVPRISLKQDFYKLKATNISVDLTQAGVDIDVVNDVYVDGERESVSGKSITLSSVATGRYEIAFYINNEKVEYITDLIVADKFISSVDDLVNMKNNLTAYYVLTQDIDAQGASVGHLFDAKWYGASGGAINIHTYKDKGFKGTLDGNGHTISNIKVDGYGLFGTVSPEGIIKNLGIRNVMCTTTDGINFPLATEFYGTMENVSFHMTNHTELAPIGILQVNSTLRNVVFYVPDTSSGAICHMGDALYGPMTFENVFVFSNKKVGGIQGNAPTATVFGVSDYLSDARFTETDFSKIFDMSDDGEWFIEESTGLPLINWTPNEYLPLINGQSKPFKNNQDVVLEHSAFDTVKGIYIGEDELANEYWSSANGKVTISANYLKTMTKSTKIIVKTSSYKVECILQIVYEVSTIESFKNIAHDWYGYYELKNNIDFGGEFVQLKSWGDGGAWFNESVSTTSTGFYGTFEGNGNVLKNFKTSWGIFGGVGDTGVIRNVGFEGAQNNNSSLGIAAAIALYSYGKIDNISVRTDDTSNFYAVIARMRGSAKLSNAVVYLTDGGFMESSFGTTENVYLVSKNENIFCNHWFNVNGYLENSAFLGVDFTNVFDCGNDGMWKIDDTLKLPFIYSTNELSNIETETKTFTVTSTDCLSCSSENISLSVTSTQIFMNGAFDENWVVLTITLPDTYVKLTGVSLGDVWRNAVVNVYLGGGFNADTAIVNGEGLNYENADVNWGGTTYSATAAQIAAAGYTVSGNSVQIAILYDGGSQVCFSNLTLTYEVVKA